MQEPNMDEERLIGAEEPQDDRILPKQASLPTGGSWFSYLWGCIVFIICMTLVALVIVVFRLQDIRSLPFNVSFSRPAPTPIAHHDFPPKLEEPLYRNYSREAYVTLLAPGDPHPWDEGKPDFYYEACKIKAHRLLRNPTTRDPNNRPFVVLVTPRVPPQQIDILKEHGATIRLVSLLPPPPNTVDLDRTNPRYRDQFTKFHVWNMTEYDRVAFFDADTLFIRPIDTIFDTPTQFAGGEEWLFAAIYDSGNSRNDNQRNPPGPDDKGRPQDRNLNAGVFLLRPSIEQSEYLFSRYYNPPEGHDFSNFMEQEFLRWVYNDDGPYPWIRLSHLYNTQWPRPYDLDTAYILHDKLWNRNVADELRKIWYSAWGEMVGWAAARYSEGIQGLDEEIKPHEKWAVPDETAPPEPEPEDIEPEIEALEAEDSGTRSAGARGGT